MSQAALTRNPISSRNTYTHRWLVEAVRRKPIRKENTTTIKKLSGDHEEGTQRYQVAWSWESRNAVVTRNTKSEGRRKEGL